LDTKSISITDWFAITSQEGRSGWLQFYKTFLKTPISKPAEFFQAVENFGRGIMFSAVVAASTRKLEGDPFAYVMAIAIAKVNEEMEKITATDRYAMNLQKAKQRTELQNEELEHKIHKALGDNNEHI
jgi:hypothetical protein